MEMDISNSNDGCPCRNETSTFASFSDRHCQLPSGDVGVQLTVGGSCVPFSYGSSQCLQHDLLHEPACRVDGSGERVIPAFCFRPFCYVDAKKCMKDSDERVFRSDYFPRDSGIDLYYSYSACNSTADDWLAAVDDMVGSNRALGGISITATFPTYVIPMIYKRDPANGEILSSPGDEFYDDLVPFEGVYKNYVDRIVEISKGDIRNITFTHRSRASVLVHPTSSFTAAVQDIADGLTDMAVGPFWITGQRLKMTAFTIPIVYDKTFLVVPEPGTTDSIGDQIGKVLAPFSYGLWLLVLIIIIIASLLSVWFTDGSADRLKTSARSMMRSTRVKKRLRVKAFGRLWLDSFIEKGLFFFSAGVEQDKGASLPKNILMFGFGFFILITVCEFALPLLKFDIPEEPTYKNSFATAWTIFSAAYVANLAAFLTRNTNDDIKTMTAAVEAGWTICAHPAVEAELRADWPNAHFYFHQNFNEFNGVLDDYLAGKCRGMAIGYEDTSMDVVFLERLCANNLVYTDSLVAEIPVAFPIRQMLSPGFSYWMYQGERYHDVSIQDAKESYHQGTSCNVHLTQSEEGSDYDEITIKNMFLPLLLFSVCSFIAIILQIIHGRATRSGRRSMIGRKSTLHLVTDKPILRPRRASKHDAIGETDDSNLGYHPNEGPRPLMPSATSVHTENLRLEECQSENGHVGDSELSEAEGGLKQRVRFRN